MFCYSGLIALLCTRVRLFVFTLGGLFVLCALLCSLGLLFVFILLLVFDGLFFTKCLIVI